MSTNDQKLYELIPAIYRIRDAQNVETLKELFGVIAEQIAVLEENLEQLYDDQFIETCADWVVPYIGGLIGYRSLHGIVPKVSSPRAEVANTIAYRRRKGTASILEQLARDVTGWNARAVEFFQLLATTKHMNHIRSENLSMASIKYWEPLERLNTSFDTVAHTVDVRRIANGLGLYNIPNIGIYLWRLNAYSLTNVPAFEVDSNKKRYCFNPLGVDTQLFTNPETEDEITHIAEPINVPMPISRRVLNEYLDQYYGKGKSICIEKDGTEVPVKQIIVCDLSDKAGGYWEHDPPEEDHEEGIEAKIAIDPVLGRIAFPNSLKPANNIKVTFHYGFSADMGGGEYERGNMEASTSVVSIDKLQDSINNYSADDVIEVKDSVTFKGNIKVTLASKQRLTIQAKRPLIIGLITVISAENAEIVFDGLLIKGDIKVVGTEKMTVVLRHCTIVPWIEKENGKPKFPTFPSVKWQEGGSSGKLAIENCITGRLIAADGIDLKISDSIIDSLDDITTAISSSDHCKSAAGKINILRTTVIGTVNVREIELIENCIFTGVVISSVKQQGCVRFSYLPPDSEVPRRYHCQPNLAINQAQDAFKEKNKNYTINDMDTIKQEVSDKLRPVFTSKEYSIPAYMQLHSSCPIEIRTGADDGSEMGTFHDLYQPQREINLRVRLDEYLSFGLEAGIFYSS